MEEEESHRDGVLGCSLDLHLCTGAQLCCQTQKCVQSQCEYDPVEKRKQHELDQGHTKQQLFNSRESTDKVPTINQTS